MISFDYDSDYDPPFPVATIAINLPENSGAGITHPALIDTGADSTMIPVNLLDQLGASAVGNARMRGVLGDSELVDIYLIRVQIGSYIAHAIRAVAMPVGSELILGRNVLNNFIITLNGLAHVTEFRDE